MVNFGQRALWVFWKHGRLFEKVQEVRFFNDNATKQETKRTKLNGARTMSLVQSDIDTMAKLKPYPMAMRGAPQQVIARPSGTPTPELPRHYAYLLPSYVADTIRAELWPVP